KLVSHPHPRYARFNPLPEGSDYSFGLRVDVAGLRAAGFDAAVADLVVAVEPRRAGVFALASGSAACVCATFVAWCSRAISRDLRRAAALRWTMPFWAALSSARTASRTTCDASCAVAVTASAAFFTNVRT